MWYNNTKSREVGDRMSALLRVFCPAKINLSLKVIGKREDGYHDLETIMQSISIQDVLNITLLPEGLEVRSSHPQVPPGEDNLVYKAASLLRERYAPAAGASIDIVKNIPLAAGLAGGSADAAGAIRGLNHLWNLGLGRDEMEAVASEIGSDVVFCLQGGTALARGRGELVSPLPGLKDRWLVVVKPPFEISTASVYRAYQLGKPGEGKLTREMIGAIASNDLVKIAENLFNDLEKVAAAWYPEIESIKREIKAGGALGALMSGSGPTVFGLTESREQALEIAGQFAGRYQEVFTACTMPAQEIQVFQV